MAKRAKEEFPQDTNAWMTTYTDLMTLLLTFFVLLLSMAVIDSRKQRDALNSLVGAFGFKPGAHSVMGSEKGMNITVGSAPVEKEEAVYELLENTAFKNGLESEVMIQREAERIIIGLSNKVLFGHGSSEMASQGQAFLSDLFPILKEVPGTIELRGYADPSETGLEEDPFKTGMLLSARRAMAVHHFLKRQGDIPLRKMVAHGFGVQRAKRDAGEVQSDFNRQVEIICDYRAGIPYHLRRKDPDRNLRLDYKGFTFDFKEHRGK